MKLMRLFIALPLPVTVLDELAAVQRRLRAAGLPVRWVDPAGVHLTLQFLGEAPETQVPPLLAALAALPPAPFSLRLAEIGAFPNLRRPRVIWVGLAGAVAALRDLQRAVLAATAPLGFVPEERPFSPHLTLGRLRSDARPAQIEALAEQIARAQPPAPITWESDLPRLFQSTLTSQGAVYTKL